MPKSASSPLVPGFTRLFNETTDKVMPLILNLQEHVIRVFSESGLTPLDVAPAFKGPYGPTDMAYSQTLSFEQEQSGLPLAMNVFFDVSQRQGRVSVQLRLVPAGVGTPRNSVSIFYFDTDAKSATLSEDVHKLLEHALATEPWAKEPQIAVQWFSRVVFDLLCP